MKRLTLLFTILVFPLVAVFSQFSDDFEGGDLSKWIIAGRQQGINKAEVIEKNGSSKAYLRHEDFTEITLENTFPYNPGMSFNFQLETNVNSTSSSTSDFYAAAGVKFEFYDNAEHIVGQVSYITLTSSYAISNSQGKENTSINEIPEGQIQNYSLSVSELLDQIVPSGVISKVKLRFYGYASGWPYSMVGEVWVDDVYVTEEPYEGPSGDLIAYFPFNGNANDESGYGNKGTVNGAVLTDDLNGNENAAYYFDGSGSHIEFGNKCKPDFPFSVSTWIKRDDNETAGDIISNDEYDGANYYHGFLLVTNTDGALNAAIGGGYAGPFSRRGETTDSGVIIPGKFQHIVAVFNSVNDIKIYVDGVKQTTTSHGSETRMTYSSAPGKIGSSRADHKYAFKGTIDEVRIYSKSLSEEEISSLFEEAEDNSDVVVDIETVSDLYYGKNIYKNSMAYFYCNIEQGEDLQYLENSRLIPISSSEGNIPAKIRYLGNGILQMGIDFKSYPNLSSFELEFPAEVRDVTGATIHFTGQTDATTINLEEAEVEQNIDLFAGLSVGAKLTAGSIGAGPSISAAAISVEGTAGMGMKFSRNLNGDQYISRRLEIGVGSKVEAPELNTVVGDVDIVTVNAGVTGTAEQKMIFPADQEDDLMLKAKAYTILETFSLGGIELSPMSSLFIRALKNSLMNNNPDLQEVYKNLYYSTKFGVASTIGASAGLSFKLAGENCAFSLGEAGMSTTMAMGLDIEHLTNNRKIDISIARDYNVDLLKFDFFESAISGNLIGFEAGASMGVDANFIKNEGLQNFGLSFETSNGGEILITDFSLWNNFHFNVPKVSVLASTLAPDFRVL